MYMYICIYLCVCADVYTYIYICIVEPCGPPIKARSFLGSKVQGWVAGSLDLSAVESYCHAAPPPMNFWWIHIGFRLRIILKCDPLVIEVTYWKWPTDDVDWMLIDLLKMAWLSMLVYKSLPKANGQIGFTRFKPSTSPWMFDHASAASPLRATPARLGPAYWVAIRNIEMQQSDNLVGAYFSISLRVATYCSVL